MILKIAIVMFIIGLFLDLISIIKKNFSLKIFWKKYIPGLLILMFGLEPFLSKWIYVSLEIFFLCLMTYSMWTTPPPSWINKFIPQYKIKNDKKLK